MLYFVFGCTQLVGLVVFVLLNHKGMFISALAQGLLAGMFYEWARINKRYIDQIYQGIPATIGDVVALNITAPFPVQIIFRCIAAAIGAMLASLVAIPLLSISFGLIKSWLVFGLATWGGALIAWRATNNTLRRAMAARQPN